MARMRIGDGALESGGLVARAGWPARRASWVATLPLAVMAGTGMAIALSAVGTRGFLVPAERRGVRDWIDGPLAGLGFHVTTLQFGIEVAAMSVAYFAAMAMADGLNNAQLGAAVAAMFAIFFVAPPLLSTDVFNYIDYARLGAVHHLDPYGVFPSAAPHDAIYRFAHWHHTRSAYGPLFTLPSYLVGHMSVSAALWAFKAVSALSGLACVALVARIASRLGRSPRVAAATFGLNPIVLIWTVGGGHNDTLMLAALLGGIALVVEKREAWGGSALVAAVAIKASAGLALPFLLLGAGRRWRLLAGAAAAAVVTVAVAYVAFPGHAAGEISVLLREGRFMGRLSVPRGLVRMAGLNMSPHLRLALVVLLAGALTALAVRVWRGGDWVRATGWAFVALLATSTWIVPWYLIWPLSMAAVCRDRRMLAVTVAVPVFLIVSFLTA